MKLRNSSLIAGFFLLSVVKIESTVDPMSALFGGIAGATAAGAVGITGYFLLNDNAQREYNKRLLALRIAVDVSRGRYGATCEVFEQVDNDQKIKKASFLSSTSSPFDIKAIRSDVHDLGQHIAQAEDSLKKLTKPEQESMRRELQEDIVRARSVCTKLTELQKFVEQEHPFIMLNQFNMQEKRMTDGYDATVRHANSFPYISAVNQMNQDFSAIQQHVAQASALCKERQCRDFQKNLIAWGNQYLKTVEQKRRDITSTQKFAQERERYERIEAERERAAADRRRAEVDYKAAKNQEECNELLRNEQKIKEEQQRQDALKMAQGILFAQEKKEYENRCAQKINSVTVENNTLKNKQEQLKQEMHTEEQELEQVVQSPPYNIEKEKGAYIINSIKKHLANLQKYRDILQ